MKRPFVLVAMTIGGGLCTIYAMYLFFGPAFCFTTLTNRVALMAMGVVGGCVGAFLWWLLTTWRQILASVSNVVTAVEGNLRLGLLFLVVAITLAIAILWSANPVNKVLLGVSQRMIAPSTSEAWLFTLMAGIIVTAFGLLAMFTFVVLCIGIYGVATGLPARMRRVLKIVFYILIALSVLWLMGAITLQMLWPA